MTTVWMVLVAALSAALAYLIATRLFHLPPRGLGPAAGRLLECAGATAVFFGGNTLMAVGGVFVVRALGWRASLYFAADPIWLLISLVEAVTFVWWWNQRGG